jgi:phosphoserine phosphatase RsbU/P
VSNRKFFQFLLLLVVAFAVLPAHAAAPRAVDGTSFGDSVSLGPEWLFHPGDDAQWASPTFDDHDWTVVSAQRELISYGIRNVRYGWYRMHIRLRPGAPAPVVVLGNVFGSYEVFANGARIGGHGRMDRHTYRWQLHPIGFPVPAQAIASGDLVLAIRFDFNPSGNNGSGTSTPIGNDSAVALGSPFVYGVTADAFAARYTFASVSFGALALLIAIVAFALGGALRARGEYIAVGVFLLATAAGSTASVWEYWTDTTFTHVLLSCFVNGLAYVALIEFIRLVVRQPRRRWIVALEAVTFVCSFSYPLCGIAGPTQFLYRLGFFLAFLPFFAMNIVLLVLLARALRGGNREARFLLPAFLISGLPGYWIFGDWSLYYLHITPIVHSVPSWRLGPYQFGLGDACGLVFGASILLFLVLRTLRIARRNAQVSAELEAARATQQLLLARSTEPTPGFDVQTVYHPASEVGGDFFAVQPAENGSLLVAVGDVSGKGIQAAMTVSEILGALRGCTERRPAAILQYLNNVLRKQKGGFVTCCVTLITPDGEIAIANAGHLAPYRNGEELPVDSGLPLGIVEGASWAETVHSFANSERLTFVSDGVVEARSATGELYGFERTRATSMHAAEEIASEARAFGQEDDITVLTIALAPVPVAV